MLQLSIILNHIFTKIDKMLKNLLYLLCVAVFAVSCFKNKDNGCPYQSSGYIAPQAEQDALATYLDSNGIEATKHPAGFYYKIANAGTGADSARLCSQIQVEYEGRLINGNIFDSSSNFIFVLGGMIEGWRKGVPLIRKGGEISLFIPPSLGYGSQPRTNSAGEVVIPGNSILIFDVKLFDYTAGN